jgi:hypothetical protein
MAQPKLKSLPSPEVDAGSDAVAAWHKPKGLSKLGWALLAGAVALINLPLLHRAVKGDPEATVQLPYEDSFSEGSPIRKHYFTTGGLWRIVNGELFSPGVRNNPFWLKARLPQNVVIDFDVRCASPDGDIRVEIFGNGVDHLSGYELIHGGWNNSQSAIVRLKENAPSLAQLQTDARQLATGRGMSNSGLVETGVYGKNTAVRVDGQRFPVRPNQTYHWRIERRGSLLRWSIDGQTYLEFNDPLPLTGAGHDRFGLSSAESDIYYDNLRVVPLANATDPGPAPTASKAAPPKPPPGPFADSFERTSLGPDWLPTDPSAVQIEGGSLTLQRAHNHPLWLTRPIPTNAAIEFDCWSDSPEGATLIRPTPPPATSSYSADGATPSRCSPRETSTRQIAFPVRICGSSLDVDTIGGSSGKEAESPGPSTDRTSSRSPTLPRWRDRNTNTSRSPISRQRSISTTCGSKRSDPGRGHA